ncbi:HSPB1-associated protein 1-like isoform X2 [Montipora foliosa]|uniref:HSPB1-associated protein 1-like isoform X2 n=1 Tax=Montipora foliosa TaxID=591990 RepID=UPI0035F1CBC1
MAGECGFVENKIDRFEVERICVLPDPVNLRDHLLNRSEPALFHGAASQWECAAWTPEFLAARLGELRTNFRLFSRSHGNSGKSTVMETDCEFESATFTEFIQWLNGCMERSGSLSRFHKNDYWCYADYKYMAELFHSCPDLRQSVNWGAFGFPGRCGDESTIWIGSKEASTPCHLDTYGCNLVAQIYGRKKWTLFPPSETPNLYPTRIPYEESSVFSQVHMTYPDLSRFPTFASATRYEVILQPGDVLFVPKKWWHYVESLETSISINTWIELESDHIERVREALIRTLVCALKKEEGANELSWVNPSENIGTHEHNMEYLRKAMDAVKEMEDKKESSEVGSILECGKQLGHTKDENNTIYTDDLINCLTTPEVIDLLTAQVLRKFRISKTNDLPKESLTVKPSSEYRGTSLPLSIDSDHAKDRINRSLNEWEMKKEPPRKRKHK